MGSQFNKNLQRQSGKGMVIFLVLLVFTFLLGLLASSIMQRKVEAITLERPMADIANWEADNSVWGKSFPREYDTYKATADTNFKSKYNGNATIDMLEVDPRLVVLWAGYGFAKDYNQGRGHIYAVEDVRNTLRTGAPRKDSDGPMPTTCWTCKSPDVPRLMDRDGSEKFYTGKWYRYGHEVTNPIGCADCHDPKDMSLRISRPALKEAYNRMGKNIDDATHQEMRSLVCAQCHVEYYFSNVNNSKYLVFPWDKGMSAEAMEAYYDELEFKDWTHKLSKAPMLKAQHPGYEVYLTGIHAERGVSCADCHMPYKTEGGAKFTDHKIQSPLNNVANSCQVCHRESEHNLMKNVYDRQDKIIENRDKLEELLVRAHVEAKLAWDKGATEEEMQSILQDIRHAQWRWDYAAASHGGSFHSPVEIYRVIATGMDRVLDARLKLARVLATKGFTAEVPYPDISTKAKAQAYIGLPVKKLQADKDLFLDEVVPKWLESAAGK